VSKFIVVTFANEGKAYEGTQSLRTLHDQGSLTLYEVSVIVRTAEGRLSVKKPAEESALGLAVGSLVGGLVGLMGGPIGGFIGLTGGALLGSVSDLYRLGITQDFLEILYEEIKPGTVAVVAEISEERISPLDTAMAALGGRVLRRWRDDMEEEQAIREHLAFQQERTHLKAEWEQASSENKAQLHGKLDHLQSQIQTLSDRLRTRVSHLELTAEAKIKALTEQASRVKADAKGAVEARLIRLQADVGSRSEKFKQAWNLTKEALTL